MRRSNTTRGKCRLLQCRNTDSSSSIGRGRWLICCGAATAKISATIGRLTPNRLWKFNCIRLWWPMSSRRVPVERLDRKGRSSDVDDIQDLTTTCSIQPPETDPVAATQPLRNTPSSTTCNNNNNNNNNTYAFFFSCLTLYFFVWFFCFYCSVCVSLCVCVRRCLISFGLLHHLPPFSVFIFMFRGCYFFSCFSSIPTCFVLFGVPAWIFPFGIPPPPQHTKFTSAIKKKITCP